MDGLIQFIEFLVYVLTRCKGGRGCVEELVSCIEARGGTAPYITRAICYNEFRDCLRRECGLWV